MRYVTHVKNSNRDSPQAVIAAKSESESGVLFCVKSAVAQRTRAESRFKKVRIFSPTIMFLLSQQSDSRYSADAMKFKLDYDKMLFLDAEDLAEAGIKKHTSP